MVWRNNLISNDSLFIGHTEQIYKKCNRQNNALTGQPQGQCFVSAEQITACLVLEHNLSYSITQLSESTTTWRHSSRETDAKVITASVSWLTLQLHQPRDKVRLHQAPYVMQQHCASTLYSTQQRRVLPTSSILKRFGLA